KRQTVERAVREHQEAKHSSAERSKDHAHGASQSSKARSCSVIPTAVGNLPLAVAQANAIALPRCGNLHRHLYNRRYFMTPGLRFGAHLSVYPGDPFRYHAHFL